VSIEILSAFFKEIFYSIIQISGKIRHAVKVNSIRFEQDFLTKY